MTSSANAQPRSKDFYMALMQLGFIAIRAEDDISKAHAIADMFHNLPGKLIGDWTPEKDLKIYEWIRSKADVHGLTTVLDSWEQSAFRTVRKAGEGAS